MSGGILRGLTFGAVLVLVVVSADAIWSLSRGAAVCVIVLGLAVVALGVS